MIAQSSQTALTVAAARAAHLIVDREPRIFADTLADSRYPASVSATRFPTSSGAGDDPLRPAALAMIAQVTVAARAEP
jgi:O-methyltransferase involved in polyketide biosynthesis